MSGILKECTKCKYVLPIKAFRKDRRSLTGYGAYCVDCARASDREARKRKYSSDPAERARKKSASRGRVNSQKIIRGRNAVRKAIENGVLIKPKACSNCGEKGLIHAHHDDYRRLLKVRWLCPQCHMIQHRKPSVRDAFRQRAAKEEHRVR